MFRDKVCYGKTANVFGISRTPISGIIRRVSYVVTTFLGPKLIRLSTTDGEVQELTDEYLEVHDFPQGIGAIERNLYKNSRTK